MIQRVIWLIVLAGALTLGTSRALAYGLPLDAVATAERTVLLYSAGQQHVITSVALEQSDQRAALLVPVPAAATIDQPTGAMELLDYLEAATAPQQNVEPRILFAYSPTTPGSAANIATPTQTTIGGYEVAQLDATDLPALAAWSAANDYTLPAAAEPILADYLAQGWRIVVIQLAADAPLGSLAPLRISFSAQEIVYPLRLAALAERPPSLQLYVLADQRMATDALTTTYAGPVRELTPPPSADVTALLNDAAYITRFEATQPTPTDAVVRPSATNEPYRATETVYTTIYLRDQERVIGALVGMVFVSLLAVAFAFVMKRRLDTISPDRTKH